MLQNLYKFRNIFYFMEDPKIEKQSKDIKEIEEGDSFFINGSEMKVDKQYLFLDHGDTKEMIIEVFNPKNDREYQIRYFDDQVESSIEIYELIEDFQHVRRVPKVIAW